jgi:hypothetical protein
VVGRAPRADSVGRIRSCRFGRADSSASKDSRRLEQERLGAHHGIRLPSLWLPGGCLSGPHHRRCGGKVPALPGCPLQFARIQAFRPGRNGTRRAGRRSLVPEQYRFGNSFHRSFVSRADIFRRSLSNIIAAVRALARVEFESSRLSLRGVSRGSGGDRGAARRDRIAPKAFDRWLSGQHNSERGPLSTIRTCYACSPPHDARTHVLLATMLESVGCMTPRMHDANMSR